MEISIKLLKIISIICFSILSLVNNLSAQTSWEEIMIQSVEENEDNAWEMILEELNDLKENPININTATKEQLEKFPFLSSQLVENILYYIYKYGPMLSEKELLMIENMDKSIIRYLLPFITFESSSKKEYIPTFQQVLKFGKQELSVRFDFPFYTKEGYKSHYLGYGFYHNLRYSFKYSDKVYFGLTAEKDAGEPFFDKKNKKGYDYYSPYLFIRDIGKIKALAIGNYRLNYGCGLIMNTGFGLGKTATLFTLGNVSKGIQKHSSTDEYNYFQGIALSYKLSKRLTADIFYSYRNMSGSVDNQFITSLKKDGYYRTETDLEKRNQLSNQLIGSNIHFNGKYYEWGITSVYNVFNKVFNLPVRYYNMYYPRGRDFLNWGINYKLFWKQFTFWGETATDKNMKIATLNVLRYTPKSGIQFIVMNRFYDLAYQSLYARSISEGNSVQNENGIYIGLETSLLRHFKLTAYVDWFYFPWKKYLINKSGTSGLDGFLQINYSPVYELDMFIRYRYKNKYKDYTNRNGEKKTVPYIQHKWRYQFNYDSSNDLMLKTTVDYIYNYYKGYKSSQGILIAQSIGYPFKNLPFKIDGNIAWFCTDDYSSRISFYEKSLLYMFSNPSLYGKGIRFSFLTRYEFSKHLIFQAKYGLTYYSDRKTIGTGLEQINGNVKSDLYLQLRVKF